MQKCLFSADRALAQRMEAADSAMTAGLLPANALYASEAVAGGYCLFGGAESPFTHAVGVGMQAPAGEAVLDQVEAFYRARGVDCAIDLCPMADPDFHRAVF